MDDQEIRSKLNEQNQRLLHEIESNMMPVRFEEWDVSHYAGKIAKSQGCGIVYCMSDLHQAKIAHELLHIKTGYLLGDTGIMLKVVGQCANPIAHAIIADKFCEDLVNQTEHSLFFEEYLAMGYNALDFFESMCLPREATVWIDLFDKQGLGRNGIITKDEAYSYLGVMILLSLYPIKGQYRQQLKKVSTANAELAGVMKKFVSTISTIVIEAGEKGKLQNAYMELANDIISWVSVNKVTL